MATFCKLTQVIALFLNDPRQKKCLVSICKEEKVSTETVVLKSSYFSYWGHIYVSQQQKTDSDSKYSL